VEPWKRLFTVCWESLGRVVTFMYSIERGSPMACVRMMRSMFALQPNLEVTSAQGESVNLHCCSRTCVCACPCSNVHERHARSMQPVALRPMSRRPISRRSTEGPPVLCLASALPPGLTGAVPGVLSAPAAWPIHYLYGQVHSHARARKQPSKRHWWATMTRLYATREPLGVYGIIQ